MKKYHFAPKLFNLGKKSSSRKTIFDGIQW